MPFDGYLEVEPLGQLSPAFITGEAVNRRSPISGESALARPTI